MALYCSPWVYNLNNIGRDLLEDATKNILSFRPWGLWHDKKILRFSLLDTMTTRVLHGSVMQRAFQQSFNICHVVSGKMLFILNENGTPDNKQWMIYFLTLSISSGELKTDGVIYHYHVSYLVFIVVSSSSKLICYR